MLTIFLVSLIALLGGFTFWYTSTLSRSLGVATRMNEDARKDILEVKPFVSELTNSNKEIVELFKSGKAAEAEAFIFNKVETTSEKINQRLDLISEKIENNIYQNSRSGTNTLFMIGAFAFLSIIVGFLFSLWSLKNLKKSLGIFLNQVSQANENISLVSERLATANNLFSSSTTMGAVTWQEAATSIDNLSTLSETNSNNALKASTLFMEKIELGEKEVSGLSHEQLDLGVSSKKMEEVINAIDEIAFEMNLLALNAATEATKAGDQGKGFSLIADSIRTLAEQSSSSAKDAHSMIKDSLDQLDSRGKSIQNSKQALESVFTSIKEIAKQNQQIATALASQSEGIKQVGHSMSQIDAVAQQAVEGTQEIFAISNLVVEESTRLESLVQTLNHRFIGDSVNH